MISSADSPRQLDTIQQQPLMKKGRNPIWIVVFILFLFGNWIWISNITKGLESGGFFAIGGFLGMIMVLALIDLMMVLVYIYIQQSHGLHGTANSISYAILIAAILALIFPTIIMAALF